MAKSVILPGGDHGEIAAVALTGTLTDRRPAFAGLPWSCRSRRPIQGRRRTNHRGQTAPSPCVSGSALPNGPNVGPNMRSRLRRRPLRFTCRPSLENDRREIALEFLPASRCDSRCERRRQTSHPSDPTSHVTAYQAH